MRAIAAVLVAVSVTSLAAGATRAACVGDCGGKGSVAVSDLVLGVNIALGNRAASSCAAFDADSNGTITINEVVAAVGNALNGCGFVSPTPSFTATPGAPTPTPTAAASTATPTSGIIPPGIDSRFIGTWSGSVRNTAQQMKNVSLRIEVVGNQVRVTDLGRNLFTASGSETIVPQITVETNLTYNHTQAPQYAEIFQASITPPGSLAVQYTTTGFTFPPHAESYAGNLLK